MARQRDLDKLLADLHSFLLLLDREKLSAAAQARKRSVAELLRRLQSPPGEDAEYMIMRSPASSGERPCPGAGMPDAPRGRPRTSSPGRSPPGADSYEDAETAQPGARAKAGEHRRDSDSSHYESYGEEEEEEEEEDSVKDRAHYLRRPPAAGTAAPGRPEPQLCAFLWRKRWLGRWVKQLFIIREHVLLCFRCAKDLQPLLRLELRGCRVAYRAKPGKEVQHELKVTAAAGAALVIGFTSRQHAEDWRKVIQEVGSASCVQRPALRLAPSPCRPPRSSPRGADAGGGRGDGAGTAVCRLSRRWQWLCRVVQRRALRTSSAPRGARRPTCHPVPAGHERSPGTGTQQQHRGAHELAALEARGHPAGSQWSPHAPRSPGCPGRSHSDEEKGMRPKTPWATGATEATSDGTATGSTVQGDVGGLLLRHLPMPNAYMDEPSGQPHSPQPARPNAQRLQQLSLDQAEPPKPRRRPLSAVPAGASAPARPAPPHVARAAPHVQPPEQSPALQHRDFFHSQHTLTLPASAAPRDRLGFLTGKRAVPKLEGKGGRPERSKGRPRAGSELNLLALGKSLKGHLAASAEGAFLTPLLKRTASAKSAPKQAPAIDSITEGQVLQRRKEWEMKSGP